MTELKAGITKAINDLANQTTDSTARYVTWNAADAVQYKGAAVCFHMVPSHCHGAKGLGIIFQGYGGFDKANAKGDRFRAATEADLIPDHTYPFIQTDHGHYNEVSLKWLTCMLDPNGPFKPLLPHMLETDPEAVQARKCFVFPDVSSIPARLTWCFAIASRLGFSNARVVWRYIFLLEKGLSSPLAMLMASGFEPQVKGGQATGKITKSYIGGYLGADVTAYAGRFLSCDPVSDPAYKQLAASTYGSSDVFLSGKLDLKNMVFDTWDDAVNYTVKRADEQIASGYPALKAKVA